MSINDERKLSSKVCFGDAKCIKPGAVWNTVFPLWKPNRRRRKFKAFFIDDDNYTYNLTYPYPRENQYDIGTLYVGARGKQKKYQTKSRRCVHVYISVLILHIVFGISKKFGKNNFWYNDVLTYNTWKVPYKKKRTCSRVIFFDYRCSFLNVWSYFFDLF